MDLDVAAVLAAASFVVVFLGEVVGELFEVEVEETVLSSTVMPVM